MLACRTQQGWPFRRLFRQVFFIAQPVEEDITSRILAGAEFVAVAFHFTIFRVLHALEEAEES